MPVNPTYPGVYIQEIDSGVRTIAGVPTSITAFVGRAKRGKVNTPVPCFNYGEYSRRFGGLWSDSTMSYCVNDFFANGGGQCEVVRLFKQDTDDDTGIAQLSIDGLELQALDPGSWGNNLTGTATHPATQDPDGAAQAAAKIRTGS